MKCTWSDVARASVIIAAVPRFAKITLAMREEFLERVRQGDTRPQAAVEVGSTGSAFRTLCKKEPDFNRLYEEAKVEGEQAFMEKLRTEYRRRAFLSSDKLLHNLALATLPELESLRTSRFEVGNIDGNAFEVMAAKYFDVQKLTQAELDTMIALLEKARPDEPKQLPPGSQNGG